MKHINLTQMLQGCSKRNGMTVSASNSDGEPTVNRQSRLMSLSGKKAEKEQLSPSCLLSASFPLSFRSRYLRYAAMIFCVLAMSIGEMWGDNYTETFTNPTGSYPPAGAAGKGYFTLITVSGNIAFNNNSINIGTAGNSGTFTISTLDGSYIDEIRLTEQSGYEAGSITSSQGTVTGPTARVYTFTPNTSNLTSVTFSMASSDKKTRIAPIAIDISSDREYFTKNFSVSSGTVSCTKSNASTDITMTTTGSVSSNQLQLNSKALTITSAGHNIKAVRFTAPTHSAISLTASTGTYSSNAWTATADTKTVTFTSSSNVYIIGISVELAEIGTTYDITYDKGANGTGTISGGKKKEGEAYTLSSNVFTRAGYAQAGWSLTDGGAKAYSLGGSYTTDAAQTFYPYWEATTSYTFNYENSKSISELEGEGWIFNSKTFDADPTDSEAYANLVSAMNTAGLTAPKSSSMPDYALAIAKNGSAYAEYVFSEPTTVSGLTGTIAVGSGNSDLVIDIIYFNNSGSELKKISTTHSGTNWGDNSISDNSVVENVKRVRIKCAKRTSNNALNWTIIKTLSITYVGEAAAAGCANYSFHYGTTKGSEDQMMCFSQVGSSTTYITEEWTIPSSDQWTYVGWQGSWHDDNAKSANLQLSGMRYGLDHSNTLGSISTNVMEGAKGYVQIYSDNNESNKYVGFVPSGYVLRRGTDSDGWTSTAFIPDDADDVMEDEWTTPLTSFTADNADHFTYVGLKTASGYVWTNRSETRRPIFLKPNATWKNDNAKFVMYYWDDSSHSGYSAIMTDPDGDGVYEAWIPNTYSYNHVLFGRLNPVQVDPVVNWDNKWNKTTDQDLPSDKNLFEITGGSDQAFTGSWSVYGSKGKFHIWSSSNTNNWYCQYYPHYVLTYDANGGSGEPSAQSVPVDGTSSERTVEVAAGSGMTPPTGYYFYGWNPSESSADAGTKDGDYDPEDDVTLSADVTVYAVWKPILVTGISVSPDSKTLDVGGTQQLSVDVLPATALDKTVTWGTSNGSVATVSSTGLVTAVAPGSATITATAHDGSGETGTCSITVNKITPAKYDFSVDKTVLCGEETATLTLEDSEDGVTYELREDSSTPIAETQKTGTGSALTWTGLGAGTYVVYAVETATYSERQMNSSKIAISAGTATSITTQPTNQEVTVDEEATLTVVAAGTSLSYQWKESATEGGTYTNVASGGTSASYSVTPDAAGTKWYKCVVTGTCGTETTVARKIVAVAAADPLVSWTMDIESAHNWGTASTSNHGNTEISSISANNTHAAQLEGKTAGSSKTAGCTTAKEGTARDNDIYVEFCFTVAAGKKVIPSKVTLEVSNIGGDSDGKMTYDAILSDGTRSISGSVTPTSDGTLTELKFTNADDSKYLMGNVTLRVYPYNNDGGTKGSGFRMGQYVKVYGEIEDACTPVAAPTDLTCSAQTINSLTFTWTKADNASTYTATLYSDAGCTSEETSQDLGDVDNVTFSTLSVGTTYYCKVQSHGNGTTYCADGGTTDAVSASTKNQYTISYNNGTGDGISGSQANQTKTEGVSFTLPNVVFTRTGYTQTGWATSDGGSIAYELGGSYTTDAAQTFYPVWTINQYNVSHSLSNVAATSGATGANAATYGMNYTAEFEADEEGYTLPDDVTVTIGGEGTTHYTWNASTGELTIDGAYILGNIVVTIEGESEGCTPQTVSKVVVTGSSAGTTSGYNNKEYVGTPVINVSGKTPDATNIDGKSGDETGYKMSSDGNSIVFATLAKGTFQVGDVVKIGITHRNDTRQVDSKYNILTIYYGTNKDDATALTTIETDGDNDNSAAAGEGAGFYTYTLTASDITTIGSKKGIGLFRESSNGENPYVYSVEIIGCRDWTTCTAPTAVAADDVTGTSATFTITDAENTLDYELYISTSSTTPTAETSATATSSEKTKTVTGLSGTTTYYYWVRSNCGGFKSAWVAGTPATFTTETAYTVTYNGNGSTGGSVPTDATGYAEGDVVTVKTNSGSLVKSGGYTFVGWSTNATPSSGIFYPAGYKFTMGAGNVTLYAVWASGGASAYYYGSVSITAGALTPGSTGGHKGFFTNEGGTVATSSDISLSSTPSETGFYYESSTLTHTELSKSSNWNPSSSSKRTIRAFKFANNTSYTLALGSATATKITFYGKCGSESRILSVGGVEWTSNSTKETFEYHEFTKVGNFTGNITIGSIDATGDNRGDFYGILVVTMADGGSSGYTVTFDKNGKGSYSNSINNVPSGSKIGAPIPAPTATGYEFGGWYREAGCSNEWNFGSNTITKDTTLFAKWTDCAPSISADPSGTSYNQNADATALSVTVTGDDLEYQWYSNEENSNEDGTEIPGATSASYTPSTALVGTIYYYCVVTNDCGNATSAVAAITVNDSKPNPTASWTIATPTHGGKGFSFSVTAYKNDGSTAWDGTLTTAMLSASEDVVLSGVTVSDNTISGTYGVKASATSPVTFYLELPSTETQAAATLSEDEEFTSCSGTGGDGETYKVPMKSSYESKATGKPDYRCENENGYISPELGVSSVSLSGNEYDEFDYYINSGRSSVLVATKVDAVKKIQIYLNANGGAAQVTNVYAAGSYSSALKDYTAMTEKTDYTVSYTDEEGNTSIAKGKNGYIELAFTANLDEGTLIYVVLNKAAKYYGAKLTVGSGSGATVTTTLAWSNSQVSGATVVKGEDDADFTITATRSDAAAQASMGEIRYLSSDTKVATVNAVMGQVTIADGIDFGGESSKTTTITAMLLNSGCYKGAKITYTLQVNKSECTDAAGTIEITEDNGCEGVVMTVSGYEEGASIAWYKDGSAITPAATGTTYTATTSGTYTAVTTKTCARTSNSIVVEMETASASKIVDSWYVKNGRRTPDIALVQTTGASGFSVTSGGSPLNNIGGCTFELKKDGIIYLHGTKPNGDAPSDMTSDDLTITITVTGCGGNTDPLDITIKRQAETLKPSVAFVVDGTTRAKGGTATSVSTAKTSERPLWTYLSSSFTLTGCNIYWSVDSKELREYYSQYDAIVVTDDPNTQTTGAGGVEYVKAFGTLVDVRPILTMEAYVGRYTDGGWHVYNATPTSPNPRQVEMKLECKNHEIFAGVSDASDNVRTVTVNGDDYWYITIVDSTQSPYKGTTKDYKDLPALQGFDPSSFSDMLGIGTIHDDALQAGVERQQEPAARMMILGIQNNAMGALTNEGKLIIKNAISYLLKTNMEEVDDCSNYFTGATNDDWNEPTNWSKNSVPDFATKVRIMAPVVISDGQKVRASQVDIVVDGTSSQIDGKPEGKVTINPGGALVVGGTVNRAVAPHYGIDDLEPTTSEDLIVQANADKSAALILDNSSGLTGATVQMYSRSHWAWNPAGTKIDKYWSYVAVPIQEALIPDYFYGAFTYYYVEKDGWDKKWDGDYLYPFQAIGLSRDKAGIEHFWGPLVSTENRDIKLTKTYMGGGENMIANSWTAPIQIANFDIDDFGDAKATIYMYDTGIEGDPDVVIVEEATESYTGTGTAGQWLGIPVGVAKLPEYNGLNVIPAMQTFEVDFPSEAEYGSESTLHLDYNRLVRSVDITEDNLTERLHAPKRSMSKNDGDVEAVMKVRVAGVHTLADVWLIQDGAFSDGYDNGWEANYAACDDRSPQLYAHSEMGNMGVIAKPELEGTILGFAPSRDGADYTFSFYYRGDEELYLNDLLTETSTLIDNEMTYAFTSSDKGNGSRFIISRNPYQSSQVTTGTEEVSVDGKKRAKKIIYNDKIYILYNGVIYDAMGKVINRK